MYDDAPPKLPFGELPELLRKRIGVPAGRERTACWFWIGKTKAARQRYKPYQPTPDFDGIRENAGRHGRERATPKATHPLTKKETDAHRLVYSFATCTPIDDVPQLGRCHDDRCVSPYHVVTNGPTIAQQKRSQECKSKVNAGSYTVAQCLTLLRAANDGDGVAAWLDKDSAADEADIPRDQLTDECWAQYVQEESDDDAGD